MKNQSLLIPGALAVGPSPVVTWWLVGDLSEDVTSPDYLVAPPDLAGSTETMIGVIASILVAFGFTSLIVLNRRGRIAGRELQALLPLLAIGLYVGFSARVVTAGVVGANIGAGLLIMLGLFFIPAMLLLARRLMVRARTERRSQPR